MLYHQTYIRVPLIFISMAKVINFSRFRNVSKLMDFRGMRKKVNHVTKHIKKNYLIKKFQLFCKAKIFPFFNTRFFCNTPICVEILTVFHIVEVIDNILVEIYEL